MRPLSTVEIVHSGVQARYRLDVSFHGTQTEEKAAPWTTFEPAKRRRQQRNTDFKSRKQFQKPEQRTPEKTLLKKRYSRIALLRILVVPASRSWLEAVLRVSSD